MQRVGLDELDTQEGVTYYWREAPFTGTGYELRPDGTLWSEIEFVGGKQQGVSRDWYPSGQRQSETEYYNGVAYGTDRKWDEAGRLRRESHAEYGFRVAEKQWDEAGRLILDFELKPGHPHYDLLQNFRAAYGADPRGDGSEGRGTEP